MVPETNLDSLMNILSSKMLLTRAQGNSLAAKVLILNALDAGSDPGHSASYPASCMWPAKAVEDTPKP